jgi:NADH pyrophosphatase NudC (nudix superfamily)
MFVADWMMVAYAELDCYSFLYCWSCEEWHFDKLPPVAIVDIITGIYVFIGGII